MRVDAYCRMQRIKKNACFIKSLCKVKGCNEKISSILKKANPEQVKTLVDITLNVMKKRVPLSKKALALVQSKRRDLRHILDPKYSIKSKKRYIIQRGGGLFAPLLGAFGRSLLGRAAIGTAARGATTRALLTSAGTRTALHA